MEIIDKKLWQECANCTQKLARAKSMLWRINKKNITCWHPINNSIGEQTNFVHILVLSKTAVMMLHVNGQRNRDGWGFRCGLWVCKRICPSDLFWDPILPCFKHAIKF